MLTYASSSGALATAKVTSRSAATQKVMIVNGSSDVLEVLEPVLDAGKYDVVFVESGAHAYSQIKRVQPNLVILCLRMDDAEGFQVLSMLKLDPDTRDIPVVTYASDGEQEVPDEEEEDDEEPIFPGRPALLMN
jgi:CheY-like chemotaxis protein